MKQSPEKKHKYLYLWYIGIFLLIGSNPLGFLMALVPLWMMPSNNDVAITAKGRMKNWMHYKFRSAYTGFIILLFVFAIIQVARGETFDTNQIEESVVENQVEEVELKEENTDIKDGKMEDSQEIIQEKSSSNELIQVDTEESSIVVEEKVEKDSQKEMQPQTEETEKQPLETKPVAVEIVPSPPVQQQASIILPPSNPQPLIQEPLVVQTQNEIKEEVSPEPKKERVIPDYICSHDEYNCSSFSFRWEAQEMFDYCFPQNGDIHRLDRDNNGLVCESM